MNHTLNVFVLYSPQEVAKPSVITSLDVHFCSFLIFKQMTPIVSTNPKSETALMCLKSFLLSQSVLCQSSGMHSRITFPYRKSIFFHVWRWLDKKKCPQSYEIPPTIVWFINLQFWESSKTNGDITNSQTVGLAEGINSKSRCTKRYQTSHRKTSLGFSCYLSCPQLKMSLQLVLTPKASSSRAGSKLAPSLSHQSVICKSGQHLLLTACHCLSRWRHHLQPQWPLSLCPKKFDWSSKNIQRAESHKAVWNSKMNITKLAK